MFLFGNIMFRITQEWNLHQTNPHAEVVGRPDSWFNFHKTHQIYFL